MNWFLGELAYQLNPPGCAFSPFLITSHLVQAQRPEEAYDKLIQLRAPGKWSAIAPRVLEISPVYEPLKDGAELVEYWGGKHRLAYYYRKFYGRDALIAEAEVVEPVARSSFFRQVVCEKIPADAPFPNKEEWLAAIENLECLPEPEEPESTLPESWFMASLVFFYVPHANAAPLKFNTLGTETIALSLVRARSAAHAYDRFHYYGSLEANITACYRSFDGRECAMFFLGICGLCRIDGDLTDLKEIGYMQNERVSIALAESEIETREALIARLNDTQRECQKNGAKPMWKV